VIPSLPMICTRIAPIGTFTRSGSKQFHLVTESLPPVKGWVAPIPDSPTLAPEQGDRFSIPGTTSCEECYDYSLEWQQFIWLINLIFVGRFGMVELDFPELGEVEDTRLSMRASMVIILALSFGLWAVMLAPFGTFQ